MGKEIGVGSTFEDRDQKLKVLGKYEDGTLLVSSMDSKRLRLLRTAVAKANRVLGSRPHVEAAQELSSYSSLVVGVGERVGENLEGIDKNLSTLGFSNLALHSNSPQDLPESVFVGPAVIARIGVMYRIKCPFEDISRKWQRIARQTRRG